MKHKSLSLALLTVVFLSSCGTAAQQQSNANTAPEKPAVPVKVQAVSELASRKQIIEYPGTVVSDSEVTVAAKNAGTISELSLEVGSRVEQGQILARLDTSENNLSRTSYQNALTATQNMRSLYNNVDQITNEQINQASIGAQQAEAALRLARQSYSNLQASAEKDLEALQVTKDQAQSGMKNVDSTTSEAVKSARLAADAAKLGTELAEQSLKNKTTELDQAQKDLAENALTAADTGISLGGGLLDGINAIASLDDNNVVSIPYRSNLGALSQKSYTAADEAYDQAKSIYKTFGAKTFSIPQTKIEATITLLEDIKKAVDGVKALLENSFASGNLPSDVLSNFKLTVSNYQSQISGSILKLNELKQSFVTLENSRKSALEALQKGYDLAKQQEMIAEQALNNLLAGNTAQKDQARLGMESAQKQYDSAISKVQTQLDAAKSQVEIAELQYKNALAGVESARKGRDQQLNSMKSQLDSMSGQTDLAKIQLDNLTIKAPISGKIIKKTVAVGDQINPGESIAVINQPSSLKVQFYVDQERLPLIQNGMEVSLKNSSNLMFTASVNSIAPQADPVSKRFLIEAVIQANENGSLPVPGIIATVSLQIDKKASLAKNTILALSSINIGQNESHIFLVEDGRAKKVPVTIREIDGEYAEIELDATPDTKVVVEGNKLLTDGDQISYQ